MAQREQTACNAGDTGKITGLGRSPEGGNGSPLQYSYLGNSMERGAWRATVHGVTKSQRHTCMPRSQLNAHKLRDANRRCLGQRQRTTVLCLKY